MNKLTLLSFVAASLLFTACGEKTKEAATATEALKEDTSVVESAKQAVIDAAKEAKAKAEELAAEAKAEADKMAKAAADELAAQKAAIEKAAKEAAEAAEKKAKEIKEAAEKAAEEAKEAAVEAAKVIEEKAEAAAAVVADTASDAVDSVNETATEVVDTVMGNAAGKAAYDKCKGCHGVDGTTKALGKAAQIAGQSAADLEASLLAYKAGTKDEVGMGALMKGQVASMSDEDIKNIAEYMSGL